ncbi:MAG TPA: DUF2341 domain-containing protein [Verrucomicrobiae bacterium]|nr:DUF2341 domain-containing protein [Verrucomicrobiae bacterium]
MNKRLSVCVALGAFALFAGTGVQAQSSYSNTVMSLSPVAYWPLAEINAPSAADMYVATNLGSAQTAGDGYYETWWTNVAPSYALTNVNNIVHVAGATKGDTDTALQIGGTGQYVVWPRFTNGVANSAVTLQPPFSIEMWVYVPVVPTSLKSLFAEGGNTVQTGPAFGNALGQEGVEIGMNTSHFYFKTYDGPVVAGASLATTAGQVTANAWYHLVFTFDGTIKQAYVNTVAVSQTLTSKNSAGQVYITDLVSPMILGNGNELGAGSSAPLSGDIDEFALYTNVLSAAQVATHYAAGTNAAPATTYAQTILSDNPTIYARLDEPSFTSPSLASLPVATNYGTLGASADGLYQPGAAPGSAGPAYSGFGTSSYAVALDGFNGGVDVGAGALPPSLNPTGNQPLTVMTWFRGNPADAGPRFQDLISHGTNSYRLGLDLTPGNFFNPGAGPQLAFTNASDMMLSGMSLNDGQWHMAAGVSDGTNESLYLDGVPVKTGASVLSIPGNPQDLILGGDPFFLGPQPAAPTGYRGGLFYDGSIAQVAVFTNALTAAQIQQVFSAANVPPVIHREPTNSVTTVYAAGTNLTFQTTVSGSSPISYQWYMTNGSAVSDQTNASLIILNSTANDSGGYYLVATNLYGAATSAVITLTIYGPPTITQSTPPVLQVFAGSSPTLNLTILGTPPFVYQWTSNGVAISGATNSSYTVNASQLGATTYIGMVTNAYGAAYVTNVMTVLQDPTAPYPVQVLADSPVAYFRLDELSGTTAYDYVGGNNATYTNVVLGQPGYSSSQDPSEVAAEFGDYPPNNDYAGNVPSYLNFGTNAGNAEFSVEAWVTQYYNSGGGDAIVALGYGGGGDQLLLDTGGASSTLRFIVSTAAGVVYTAGSSRSLANDGIWHHVVGVCDEANGHLYLYLDGVLLGSTTIPAGSGLLASTIPLSIGARESANNNPVSYDYQFFGEIDDVAIYNKPLSATQVQNHYFASGAPPVITQLVPISQAANLGDNVSFTVSAIGANPLTYQWYDNNDNPISWGTNATLNLTNVQVSQAGYYSVTVSDPYNSASTNALLNVGAGPPVITTDLQPTSVFCYAGLSNTFSVTVTGTRPFVYQWYQDGNPLLGATADSYTFATLLGTNTYYCAITNSYSGGSPTLSSTATVVGIAAPEVLNPTNFSYKLKIQVTGYNRAETLQDFPMLVRLGTNVSGFSYQQFASPAGGDLRFADSSGTVSLPYEIDQWNDTNGMSTIWVQVPALSGTNDFIWAYWGNPGVLTPADYTTNGAVWLPPAFQSLPSYEVVYHLEQSGFPYLDSTLQYPATTGLAPASAPGLIGQAASFDRAPYLDAGFVNLGNAFTLSAWVDVPSSTSSIQTVWGNGTGVTDSSQILFYVDNYNTSDGSLILTTGDGTTQQQLKSATGAVGLDQWHLVTAVVDRADGDAQLYVDSGQVASGAAVNDCPTNADMNLGDDSGHSFQYTGLMDEARIRSGLSSTNWIWASWMTVAQNNAFESYAAVSSSIVTINVRHSANSVILTWPEGTLQSAGAVNGPYSDIPAATSPYTNAVSGTEEFFRVHVH